MNNPFERNNATQYRFLPAQCGLLAYLKLWLRKRIKVIKTTQVALNGLHLATLNKKPPLTGGTKCSFSF